MSPDSSRRSPGAQADRDRILEQALKHELRAADMAVTDECLDAETLAAWADDGLDGAAVLAADTHVSNCARCQAMLAAFTRGEPSTLAPGTRAPGTVAPEAPGTLAWWKWVAPIAAGAAAVTLWMVVPEQQQVAVAPAQIPAEANRAAADAPAADPPPSPSQPPSQPPSTPAPEQQAQRGNFAAGAREDRRQLRDEAKEQKQEKAAALAEAVDTAERMRTAETAAAPAAPPAMAPRAAAQESLAALSRSLAPIEIVSPDPARRWRVVGGTIERSEDDGATWTSIRTNSGETITAGTSPAASICWLIGANGLVLVTVDGVTFSRVPLPEAVAITGISATDGQNATVTTADGRRFRTADSGRTWLPF